MKFPGRVAAAVVALAAFVVYLLTLAPDLLPGDSGEFQFAAPGLRIVHPTGYPLYLLLAKTFTLLPIGTAAFRVNLLSAVCAALAVGLTFVVCQSVVVASVRPPTHIPGGLSVATVGALAAAGAAFLLAFSPTFWAQATEAEVYSLNAVLVAALLLSSLSLSADTDSSPRRSPNNWVVFAVLFGLSLAHHRSVILLLPALSVLLYPFAGLRRSWLVSALALIVPLCLYLYTPLRYDASPYVQLRLDDAHTIISLANTPDAMIAHMLGTGFGGALRWDAVALQRLVATPQRVLGELTWPGVGMVLVGVFALARSRRWKLLTALTLGIVTIALFDSIYHIGDIGDFYTPLYLMGTVLSGIGAAYLLTKIPSKIGAVLVACGLLLLPVWLLVANFAAVHDSHATGIRQGWTEVVSAGLPAGSVLISNDRDEMTPLYYLQLVDGLRPDLFGLFPLISTEPRMAHVVSVIAYALETPHPVYLTKPMDGLAIKFRLQPEGRVVRVLGSQPTTPDQSLVREAAGIRFIGWSKINASDSPTLTVALFWQATGTSRPDITTYIHVVDDAGKTVAQTDHRLGGDYYPSSQWSAGDTFRDQHDFRLGANIYQGKYRLIVGAYAPGASALGELASIELSPVPAPP